MGQVGLPEGRQAREPRTRARLGFRIRAPARRPDLATITRKPTPRSIPFLWWNACRALYLLFVGAWLAVGRRF